MSKWIAKRAYPMKMVSEQDMQDSKVRVLVETVTQIAKSQHITLPEIAIYKAKDPNAFAT